MMDTLIGEDTGPSAYQPGVFSPAKAALTELQHRSQKIILCSHTPMAICQTGMPDIN